MSLPYFPLAPHGYDMTMNARPDDGALIEIDLEHYAAEMALKADILASDPRYYSQCPPDAHALAWECIELILPDLAARYPQHFSLRCDGPRWTWRNQLLGARHRFTLGESASLPASPLDWLGRQVPEDLIVMRGDEAVTMAAGQLCFASRWSIDDKIGRGFLEIHWPASDFIERIGDSSLAMMQRLKAHRPTGRCNWTISANGLLNLAPCLVHEWIHTRREITHRNAGERLHLRVERQMFARLPRTGGLLFTIHTYLTPLDEVVADAARLKVLARHVMSVPRPTREHKGWTQFYDTMVEWLEIRLREHEGAPRMNLPALRNAPPKAHHRPAVLGEIARTNAADADWQTMTLPAYDLLDGDPQIRVHWLKQTRANEPSYGSGLRRLQPAKFRWLFAGNESLHIMAGRATITTDDGTITEIAVGDLVFFPMNTPSVWQVQEELTLFFVTSL